LIKVKQQLFSLCLSYIEQRIETARQAIEIAQASANEETKSSAGDKYETGRAMMQLEIEKNSIQLSEAQKLKQALNQINPEKSSATVQLGSIVFTNHGNFYIAISAGQLKVDNEFYFAIAPTSPIGLKLSGLAENAAFTFNSRTYTIHKVT